MGMRLSELPGSHCFLAAAIHTCLQWKTKQVVSKARVFCRQYRKDLVRVVKATTTGREKMEASKAYASLDTYSVHHF